MKPNIVLITHGTVCLLNDPHYAARVRYWRGKLVQELVEREEGFSDGTQLFVGRKVKPVLIHILGDSK